MRGLGIALKMLELLAKIIPKPKPLRTRRAREILEKYKNAGR